MIHTKESLEKLVRRLAKQGQQPEEKAIPISLKHKDTKDTKPKMETKKPAVPVENLMDSSLDNLADLPAFEVPPLGHYKLALTLENKVVNEHPAITANLVVQEVLELADANDKRPELGAKFSQLFMMDNEFGQGGFKEFIKPISAGLNMGSSTVRDILGRCAQPVMIAATVKHRVHKEDKSKPKAEQRIYANLTNVSMV